MATKSPPGDADVDIPEYTMEEMGVPETRDEVREVLNELQLELYEEWRLEFARWAFYMGKKPYFHEGYSKKSIYNIMNRVERFTAWLYREGEGFTTTFKPEHLDAYWDRVLRTNDAQTQTNRRTINNASLVVKHRGMEYDIPRSKEVYEQAHEEEANGFNDWLSASELDAIRDASLSLFVLNKDTATAEQIDEKAAKLAEILGTPKSELLKDDWMAAESWKIPSLVYVSCDVGFRPTEVEESRISWLRLDDDRDARLSIPKSEDSKGGTNNWTCYLSTESAQLLERWLAERKRLEKYDDRDEIWLNRQNNPYRAATLRTIMQHLMDEAGIDRTNREQGWYMVRRGVGTSIANSQGLSALMSQLRINRIETARRYVKTDEPAIREWMGAR